MEELELKAILQTELQNSIGQAGGVLSESRRKLLAYYNGEIDIESEPGRSRIVARNVLEAISWAMPPLLKMFATDKVFAFQPFRPEEEDTALTASEFCNYVLQVQNEGFSIFHSWFLDALITRTAYIKVFWNEEREVSYSTYEGLTDAELEQLTKTDDDIEIVEQNSYEVPLPPDPMALGGMTPLDMVPQGMMPNGPMPTPLPPPNGAMPPGSMPPGPQGPPPAGVAASGPQGLRPGGPPPMNGMTMNGMPPGMMMPPPPTSITLHDVKTRTFETRGRVKIINISPDEILVSANCNTLSLDGRHFVAHRSQKTISELRELGYSEDLIQEAMASPSTQDYNPERVDRFMPDQDFVNPTDRPDEPGKTVWLTEAYLRVDHDDDKIAELRQVCFAGDNVQVILSNEPVDEVPIIPLAAFPQSHKHQSLSLADLVVDLQDIKSVLLRQGLDSLALSTSPRIIISEMGLSENSIDDLLNVRPGSVLRVNDVSAVQPLVLPFVGRDVLSLVQYCDETQAQRSGVSRQDMGLDPQAFANQSATSAGLISAAGTGRIELIARLFGEQIKVLGRRILSLVVRHQSQPQIVKITGKWLKIQPSTWRSSMEVSVAVGLGAGNKQERMQALSAILNIQQQIIMAQKGFGGLVSAQNVFDVLSHLTVAAGLQGEYFSDPKTSPPPPSAGPEQSPQAMKAMADVQSKNARTSADIQANQAKMQSDLAIEQARSAHAMQLEELKSQHQLALENDRQAAKAESERLRLAHQMEMKNHQQMMDTHHQMMQNYLQLQAQQAKQNNSGSGDAS